jgi:hypothetical protein
MAEVTAQFKKAGFTVTPIVSFTNPEIPSLMHEPRTRNRYETYKQKMEEVKDLGKVKESEQKSSQTQNPGGTS